MSTDGLQQLVDELAAVLQRSVAVDDSDLNPVALSPHYGAIDDARVQAILAQRTAGKLLQFTRSLPLRQARGLLRVPANAELRTLPRLMVPLRIHDELFGFLWLIDADPPFSAEEVAIAQKAAPEIARRLADSSRAADESRARDTELVRALVGTDPGAAVHALTEAHRLGRLTSSSAPAVAVIAVESGAVEGLHASHGVRTALDSTLSGVVSNELVVVADSAVLETDGRAVGSTTKTFWERIAAAVASRGDTMTAAGVATSEALRTAHLRAGYAARIAGSTHGIPLVAHWDRLGAWQLLYGLPWTWETVEVLFPGFSRLRSNGELAVTVATFLNTGGDAAATVTALGIHRTSYYYRRDRIIDLVGDGWRTGPGRLAAHAAVMLAGQLDPAFAPQAPSKLR